MYSVSRDIGSVPHRVGNYNADSLDDTVAYFQSWIDSQPDAANWLLVY